MKAIASLFLKGERAKKQGGDVSSGGATPATPAAHQQQIPRRVLTRFEHEWSSRSISGLRKALVYLEEHLTPAFGKALFEESGLSDDVDMLERKIENDSVTITDMSSVQSLHSVSFAILSVLSRHEALIPSSLYEHLTSSAVDYDELLIDARKKNNALLEVVMMWLWRLVYEKKCGVTLDHISKTIGLVILRKENERVIPPTVNFQSPELQLRMATFSGIMNSFRSDISRSSGGPMHSSRPSLELQQPPPVTPVTHSVQDRSVKVTFLDPVHHKPSDRDLREALSTYGEVSNIGFKDKLAVVLFATAEAAIEFSQDNEGQALGPMFKVKYLGSADLVKEHMERVQEEMMLAQQQQSMNTTPAYFQQEQQHPGQEEEMHLPPEISAIHSAEMHHLSVNMSQHLRTGGSTSGSSVSSQQAASEPAPSQRRPSTATATVSGASEGIASGWKSAQRSSEPKQYVLSEGSHHEEEVAEKEEEETVLNMRRSRSPTLRVNTNTMDAATPQRGASREDAADEQDHVVSPASSTGNSNSRKRRQIKKIQVVSSPTNQSGAAQSRFFTEEQGAGGGRPTTNEDDSSYLDEYASPSLTRHSSPGDRHRAASDAESKLELFEGHDKFNDEEDGQVLQATMGRYSTEGLYEHVDDEGSNHVKKRRHSGSSNSQQGRDRGMSNASASSGRRSSRSSSPHGNRHRDDKSRSTGDREDHSDDILTYFAQKIAQTMRRAETSNTAAVASKVAAHQKYESFQHMKSLFEVTEQEYQHQITTLEAQLLVYQEKYQQQETWLQSIEHRWQAELLQKQIQLSAATTENQSLREELQKYKLQCSANQARITALETGTNALQRTAQVSQDKATRESLSVVISQQQLIANLDENMTFLQAQNQRLQDEMQQLHQKYAALIVENVLWKAKAIKHQNEQEGMNAHEGADEPVHSNKENLSESKLNSVVATVPQDEAKGIAFARHHDDDEVEGIAGASDEVHIPTMRSVAEREVDRYMNKLPSRYHPVVSKEDTLAAIRADTRTATATQSSVHAAAPQIPTGSSSDSNLPIEVDANNMTYSERLLATMSRQYRHGYTGMSGAYGQGSYNPLQPTTSRNIPFSTHTPQHGQQHQPHQPHAQQRPAADYLPPPPASHHYLAAATPLLASSTGVPASGTGLATHHPGSLDGGVVFGRYAALAATPSKHLVTADLSVHGVEQNAVSNRGDGSRYPHPGNPESTLYQSKLTSGGDNGMNYYAHLRAQLEAIDLPAPRTTSQTYGSTNYQTANNRLGGDNMTALRSILAQPDHKTSATSSLREDELWKMYV